MEGAGVAGGVGMSTATALALRNAELVLHVPALPGIEVLHLLLLTKSCEFYKFAILI